MTARRTGVLLALIVVTAGSLSGCGNREPAAPKETPATSAKAFIKMSLRRVRLQNTAPDRTITGIKVIGLTKEGAPIADEEVRVILPQGGLTANDQREVTNPTARPLWIDVSVEYRVAQNPQTLLIKCRTHSYWAQAPEGDVSIVELDITLEPDPQTQREKLRLNTIGQATDQTPEHPFEVSCSP